MPDAIKGAGRKKFLGIPVLVWAALGVGALMFVAWKMPSKTAANPPEDTTGGTPATDGVPTGAEGAVSSQFGMTDTGGFNSAGAPIIVNPTPATPTAGITTNQEWSSQAISWLTNQGGAAGGAAQEAITLYLNGQPLSYTQGQLRDQAIKQFGPPPEGVASISRTAAEPGRTQGVPPLTHTVKGDNDNTISELAALYYGKSSQHNNDIIERENGGRIGPSGPYPVGTRIVIPKYHEPMHYTATKTTTTAAAIAKKNGTSTTAVIAMNPGVHFPVKPGTVVVVG